MLLDILNNKRNTLKITDDIFLKEGECVNIYGDAYVGKTSICFNIVKNNPDKLCLYVEAEPLTEYYKKILNSFASKVYISNATKLINIKTIVAVLPIDFVIIDSISSLQYIEEKRDIQDFFEVIDKKKINAILVSHLKEYNNKEYFENQKVLNFFSYRIKVEKNNDNFVLNNRKKIAINDIWKKI